MHRLASFLLMLAVLALAAPAAGQASASAARYVGKPVEQLHVLVENTPNSDPAIRDLIEVAEGRPLSMEAVRESITHLYSIGRFQDIRVEAGDAPAGGAIIRFNLIPVHSVERIEFAGDLQISEDLVRKAVVERYGSSPPVGRADEIARMLTRRYQDDGYLSASVRPVTRELHDPDRTILTFEIRPGPRAVIGNVQLEGTFVSTPAVIRRRIEAVRGGPYRASRLQDLLDEYQADLRERGYYRATTSIRPQPAGGNTVDLFVTIEPGPLVTVRFEGDRISTDRLNELAPIRRERSIDEDLIEDSEARIESYLRQDGYWKADVTVRQEEGERTLAIVFTIKRGLRYRIAAPLEIRGAPSVPLAELRNLIAGLKPGDIYRESDLSAAATTIEDEYRKRGFALVTLKSAPNEVDSTHDGEGRIEPVVVITEGPRVLIDNIQITGATALTEEAIRRVIRSQAGEPYNPRQVVVDRENVTLEYLNAGYAEARVETQPGFSEDPTRIPLLFVINEGPQTIVDHIIIVGNEKTAPEVIRRELQLREGQPLGLDAKFESHRRLTALNLFRRIRIEELRHSGTNRHDVIVTVEEAPRTSFGFGGGMEITQLLRTGDEGAEERREIRPRGFFDIGRRNVGGRNRTVNLFTRVSLRVRDTRDGEEEGGSGIGISEYRVIATVRQPRTFGINDVLFTGAVEQGERASFSFTRQGVSAEIVRRLTRRVIPAINVTGRYSFSTTRVFDANLTPEEQNDIDRVFPQVRLSGFSGAIARDTRDDVLDPERGTFVSIEGSVFARSLGGQVGFMKSYVQGFWFRRLPGTRRIVFATRAAVGVADGFERENPEPPPDVLEDLPASERFYAGGDTTIRGYALDSVGTPETISDEGFPLGGNAVVILNGELRVPVWRQLGAAVFVDGGNVFRRVTEFDIGELRGSVGFGVRYNSPIGPIRLDLGFKLDRREIGGTLERRTGFHFAIGHPF